MTVAVEHGEELETVEVGMAGTGKVTNGAEGRGWGNVLLGSWVMGVGWCLG